MVYAPVGREFRVRMNRIAGPSARAWWFNPRDGSSSLIGLYSTTGDRAFMSPNPGEPVDWVLVLDAVSENYPPPGAH